ncbi:hypothetical protein AVEN_113370-1, partial [Araneus ventricosus]
MTILVCPCASFPKDETPDIYRFKLNKSNTVFQAKLAAIDFGVHWALENHKSINVHTESRSYIEALRSARPRSAFVNNVKKTFYTAGDLVGLDWVKAHVGDPGKELADPHAKLATLEGGKLSTPIPYSYIKFKICKELIKNWQCSWDNYDSEFGRKISNPLRRPHWLKFIASIPNKLNRSNIILNSLTEEHPIFAV